MYFFKTKELLKVLAKKDMSNKDFIIYASYLLALIFLYIYLPLIVADGRMGIADSKRHLTYYIQIFILLSSLIFIHKHVVAFNFFRTIKSYLSIYSTEAFTFFFVKFLIALFIGTTYVLLKVPISPGFENSHYPTLIGEVLSNGGAELIIQSIMIYRFYQLKSFRGTLG